MSRTPSKAPPACSTALLPWAGSLQTQRSRSCGSQPLIPDIFPSIPKPLTLLSTAHGAAKPLRALPEATAHSFRSPARQLHSHNGSFSSLDAAQEPPQPFLPPPSADSHHCWQGQRGVGEMEKAASTHCSLPWDLSLQRDICQGSDRAGMEAVLQRFGFSVFFKQALQCSSSRSCSSLAAALE